MHVLPQAGQIENDALVKHLESYGYNPSIKTTGIQTHNIQPINFTLLVNEFGVKYLVKEYDLQLKSALEDK